MSVFKRPATGLAALALALVPFVTAPTPASAFEPFLGEIRTFGFNFCPRGWAAADGQLLPIASNSALFSLFGTYYGGDGRTTFGLPDLRGRYEMHQGTGPGLSNRQIGAKGGQENVTLTQAEMPAHDHPVLITQTETSGDSGGLVVGQVAETGMANGGTGSVGGGQAHTNMPPYLVINKCVALQGVYPSRS